MKRTKGQTIISAKDRAGLSVSFIEEKELDLVYENLLEIVQNRLKRLMSGDYTYTPDKYQTKKRPEATTFDDELAKFLSKLPENFAWLKLYLGIFFNGDAMGKHGYLVLRSQKAGVCFMHAVAVLQHYLQCLRTNCSNHVMLDVSDYIETFLIVNNSCCSLILALPLWARASFYTLSLARIKMTGDFLSSSLFP